MKSLKYNKNMKRVGLYVSLFLSLLSAGCGGPGRRDEQTVIALKNGVLIDGTGHAPVNGAIVIIQGGRILAVGTSDTDMIPENARIYDLNGAFILPGFINAHVHNGIIEDNLKTWAYTGVTTVRDLGGIGSEKNVKSYMKLKKKRNKDPENARLVAAGLFLTAPEGYPFNPWGGNGIAIDSVDQAVKETDRIISDGADIYLAKPFNQDILLSEIKKRLKERSGTESTIAGS